MNVVVRTGKLTAATAAIALGLAACGGSPGEGDPHRHSANADPGQAVVPGLSAERDVAPEANDWPWVDDGIDATLNWQGRAALQVQVTVGESDFLSDVSQGQDGDPTACADYLESVGESPKAAIAVPMRFVADPAAFDVGLDLSGEAADPADSSAVLWATGGECIHGYQDGVAGGPTLGGDATGERAWNVWAVVLIGFGQGADAMDTLTVGAELWADGQLIGQPDQVEGSSAVRCGDGFTQLSMVGAIAVSPDAAAQFGCHVVGVGGGGSCADPDWCWDGWDPFTDNEMNVLGVVTDAETGEPVKGVEVKLTEPEGLLEWEAKYQSTDRMGRFVLPVSDPDDDDQDSIDVLNLRVLVQITRVPDGYAMPEGGNGSQEFVLLVDEDYAVNFEVHRAT